MKILLIDDDPDILLIVSFSLQKHGGHTVIKAANASDGFSKAKDHQPEAVILDYLLPDETGTELLARLHQLPELNKTKFIFLTGKSKPEEIDELLKTGVAAVITKPFQPEDMAEAVNSILVQ
jgi:CheY-like chemotaxis protein